MRVFAKERCYYMHGSSECIKSTTFKAKIRYVQLFRCAPMTFSDRPNLVIHGYVPTWCYRTCVVLFAFSLAAFSSSSNENYVFSLSMLQCTEASSYSNLCFQPEALPYVYSSRPPLYYFPSFCSYRPALSFRDMKIGNLPKNS